MNSSTKIVLGAAIGVGGYLLLSRDAKASAEKSPKSTTGIPPLPTAGHVPGADLETNWGKTPKELRPLFVFMERVSGIEGSARIFSVVSWGESRWQPTAHNKDAVEVSGSKRAIKNRASKNPKLKYESEAAEFGSGGLFGALAPYFLWTGAPEIGNKAPLLEAHPELMFIPRYAAFAAVVYLKRLLRGYKITDHLDIKVGWASPDILRKKTGKYTDIREKFLKHSITVGINLNDTSTIPTILKTENWPGVLPAYRQLTGDKLYQYARVT